jgi:hypothetical protein
MYLKRLQSTRVKGVVYVPDFRNLMQSLLVEWAGKPFLSTTTYTISVLMRDRF